MSCEQGYIGELMKGVVMYVYGESCKSDLPNQVIQDSQNLPRPGEINMWSCDHRQLPITGCGYNSH